MMTNKSLVRFFVSVLLFSWLLLLAVYLLGYDTFCGKAAFALAGISPTMFGLIYMFREYSTAERKNFFKRLTDFRLIDASGYAVILLFIPFSAVAAGLALSLFTGNTVSLTLDPAVNSPLSLLSFTLFTLVFGPLAEEIGWRGYALDRLEKGGGRIRSGFLLATVWALWHLPMFFIDGTYQSTLLSDSPLYLADFIVAFYPATIIMEWLYHNNRKSILAGVLFHFAINFYGEIAELPNEVKPVRTLIQVITALIMLFAYYGKRGVKSRRTFS